MIMINFFIYITHMLNKVILLNENNKTQAIGWLYPSQNAHLNSEKQLILIFWFYCYSFAGLFIGIQSACPQNNDQK